MTLRSDNTKLAGKDSLITRKAEKFRAILSESENSDDEFKGDSSKKSSTRVVSSNKTKFKKNKLKLGGKAKPGESSGNLTILKPFPLEAETHQGRSSTLTTSQQDSDSVIHRISSQETVVLSSCECNSSQDLSESDGENHCSSTLPLLTEDKISPTSKTINGAESETDGLVSEIIGRPRNFKRKVIDDEESVVEIKKTKTDIVDSEEVAFIQHSKENCNQENTHSLPLRDKLKVCKEDLKPHIKPDKKLSSKIDIEKELEKGVPSFSSNNGPSKVFPSKKIIAEFPEMHSTKEPKQETLSPDAKQTPEKRKLKGTPPVTKNQKLTKSSRTAKTTRQEVQCNTKDQVDKVTTETINRNEEEINKTTSLRKLTGVTGRSDSPATGLTPISTRSEKISSLTLDKIEDCVPKQQSLPKQRAKGWNPPGRALGKESTPSSSPSTGRLRLGLSRKQLAKPLHPEVKQKHC